MRRLIIAIAATALTGLASTTPAWAASTHAHGHHTRTHHTIASCRATGPGASCTVSGTIRHPNVVRAHANARPNQDATVTWSMTCTKGSDTGASSGTFTAGTPLSSRLDVPLSHADSCMVTATITLSTGGDLHAWLTSQG
jgi:hypothetical protein